MARGTDPLCVRQTWRALLRKKRCGGRGANLSYAPSRDSHSYPITQGFPISTESGWKVTPVTPSPLPGPHPTLTVKKCKAQGKLVLILNAAAT